MKEADRIMAQAVPVIATGPRPSYLSNVKLAAGAAGADPNAPPAQVSFLRKYVSNFLIFLLLLVVVCAFFQLSTMCH